MKHRIFLCAFLLGLSLSSLKAGSVTTLGGSLATDGKLVLGPKAIQVQSDGGGSEDVNLTDLLEADFGDSPLQLNFFSPKDAASQLPASWKGQDIGRVDAPGSYACANGTFTLNHAGVESDHSEEQYYFIGQPWTGDGQWTARILDVKGPQERTEAGLMLRETPDPGAALFGIGVTMETDFKCHFRVETQKGAETRNISTKLQFPVWLRITRFGASVDAEVSSNGKDWDVVSQALTKAPSTASIGLYITSRKAKGPATAVIDQVTFTPRPYSAQIIPPGVLTLNGSTLATNFESLDFDFSKPNGDGHLHWEDKYIAIPQQKVSAIVFHPMPRSQFDSVGSDPGLIMKSGDFMSGELQVAYWRNIRISSLLLGIVSYDNDDLLGCFLHPPQFQPSDYEIRLRDGSILRAKTLDANKDRCLVGEISGLNLDISSNDIAQVRAGLSRAQPLIDLPWKATPPASVAPPAAPTPPPATNAPPTPPTANQTGPASTGTGPTPEALQAANPIPSLPPTVQCWSGNNQEQIMSVPAGTSVEFPLTGKFRAVAVRVTFSPDAPPNASAVLHILADGREVSATPPFKFGEQTRFVETTLDSPKTITFVIDSFVAGTKVLLLDPVAVRQE